MPTLNAFEVWRRRGMAVRFWWIKHRYGINIDQTVKLSFSAKLLSGQSGSISIGNFTLISLKSLIISRMPDGTTQPVSIGRNCFVGAGVVIMPGVTIGDGAIIGAGSVVFDNVQSATIACGNPARLMKSGIETFAYGRLPYANHNSERLWKPKNSQRIFFLFPIVLIFIISSLIFLMGVILA